MTKGRIRDEMSCDSESERVIGLEFASFAISELSFRSPFRNLYRFPFRPWLLRILSSLLGLSQTKFTSFQAQVSIANAINITHVVIVDHSMTLRRLLRESERDEFVWVVCVYLYMQWRKRDMHIRNVVTFLCAK